MQYALAVFFFIECVRRSFNSFPCLQDPGNDFVPQGVAAGVSQILFRTRAGMLSSKTVSWFVI